MRKTIFTALVTLLVLLAVVSCDSFNGEKPEYTADGQRLVTLKVNADGIAGSRSLTDTLAKAKADYAEVIFKKGTNYYRAADYLGTISIKIPVNTYAANDAIILIGRRDGTLLATGALATGSLNVTASTPSVTFDVNSLETALNADAATPSFDINASDVPFTNIITTFEGDPYFRVKTGTAQIRATLTIDGFTGTDTNIKYDSTTGAEVKFAKIGNAPLITVAPTDITVTFVSGAGVIAFEFATTTEGKYAISFEIPVKGFDETKADHLPWKILSGLKAGTDIDGGESNGVALLVLDSDEEFANVEVTTGGW